VNLPFFHKLLHHQVPALTGSPPKFITYKTDGLLLSLLYYLFFLFLAFFLAFFFVAFFFVAFFFFFAIIYSFRLIKFFH